MKTKTRKEMQKIKNYEISDELGNKIKKVIKKVKWYQWATMTYNKMENKLFSICTEEEKKEYKQIPTANREHFLLGNKTNNTRGI